jgi:hypothetical protein
MREVIAGVQLSRALAALAAAFQRPEQHVRRAIASQTPIRLTSRLIVKRSRNPSAIASRFT